MQIVGIDASLTATAICIWQETGEPDMQVESSEPANGLTARIARFIDLAERVSRSLPAGRCDVFLEGYSFGSPNRAVPLAEYGALLRERLMESETVIEVSPSAVKKFATGKGVGDKGQVQAHVAKRWGVIFPTNDETDAYVLARIGLAYHGLAECENEAQREVIDKLKNPPAKKSKKRKAASA